MSVQVLICNDYQVLACSTQMVAFGPLFTLDDDVDAFLEWLPEDARRYSTTDLCVQRDNWLKESNDENTE